MSGPGTIAFPRGLSRALGRLRRNPAALGGTLVFLFFLLMALFGPLVAPYGFEIQHVADRLKPPSVAHLLGTDQYGRDILSRILVGSRGIFLLSGTGTLLAAVIGVSMGLFSGFYGRLWDEALMRVLDVLLSFPPLLFALLLLATVGPSALNLLLVISVLYVPMLARLARSMVLDLRTKEFVEAARIRGERDLAILFREILPNALGPILVEISVRFSYSIFLVASLGFLGLGVQPPSPDWGLQINEARSYFATAPWILLFPGRGNLDSRHSHQPHDGRAASGSPTRGEVAVDGGSGGGLPDIGSLHRLPDRIGAPPCREARHRGGQGKGMLRCCRRVGVREDEPRHGRHQLSQRKRQGPGGHLPASGRRAHRAAPLSDAKDLGQPHRHGLPESFRRPQSVHSNRRAAF